MINIKQTSVLISRLALFIIYFWFGILKVIGLSPASPLVENIFNQTLAHIPFMSFGFFIILFGLFEMLIGAMFLAPGKERWVAILFALHIVTTILPLFFMGEIWTHTLVPTLEGQYIIKNLALIACVLTIYSSVIPHSNINTQKDSAIL